MAQLTPCVAARAGRAGSDPGPCNWRRRESAGCDRTLLPTPPRYSSARCNSSSGLSAGAGRGVVPSVPAIAVLWAPKRFRRYHDPKLVRLTTFPRSRPDSPVVALQRGTAACNKLLPAPLCLDMTESIDAVRDLTVQEAAARMRTHPETIRRWLRQGLLPHAYKTPSGSGWRIPINDLKARQAPEPLKKPRTFGIVADGSLPARDSEEYLRSHWREE